jgi:hypothetical protein
MSHQVILDEEPDKRNRARDHGDNGSRRRTEYVPWSTRVKTRKEVQKKRTRTFGDITFRVDRIVATILGEGSCVIRFDRERGADPAEWDRQQAIERVRIIR